MNNPEESSINNKQPAHEGVDVVHGGRGLRAGEGGAAAEGGDHRLAQGVHVALHCKVLQDQDHDPCQGT